MLTIKNPRKDVHHETGYESACFKLIDGGLTSNDGSGKYDGSIECPYYEWTWMNYINGDRFMVYLNRKTHPEFNNRYHVRIFQFKNDTHIYENFIQKELLTNPTDFYEWMIRKIIANR
jgi:hypothetical protein